MAVIAWVYVDAFNLYYGAVKNTNLKWLNLRRAFEQALPDFRIGKIKYFTARVSSSPEDPDKSTRQQVYFRALRTDADLEIIEGYYQTKKKSARLAPLAEPSPNIVSAVPGGPEYAFVYHTEEKGSDVSLGAHLVRDAFLNCFDAGIVVSNDADLREAVAIATASPVSKSVLVLVPPRYRKTRSKVLAKVATNIAVLGWSVIKSSQYPRALSDATGEFSAPEAWVPVPATTA